MRIYPPSPGVPRATRPDRGCGAPSACRIGPALHPEPKCAFAAPPISEKVRAKLRNRPAAANRVQDALRCFQWVLQRWRHEGGLCAFAALSWMAATILVGGPGPQPPMNHRGVPAKLTQAPVFVRSPARTAPSGWSTLRPRSRRPPGSTWPGRPRPNRSSSCPTTWNPATTRSAANAGRPTPATCSTPASPCPPRTGPRSRHRSTPRPPRHPRPAARRRGGGGLARPASTRPRPSTCSPPVSSCSVPP